MDRIAIVGASLAGLRAAEALRDEGFGGSITLIDSERHRPYNRPPLSKELLAGTVSRPDIDFRGADALDAEWRLGVTAARLRLDRRQVQLTDGSSVDFDGAILACGTRARWPAWLNRPQGAIALRTVDDAVQLASLLEPGRRLVIVGAGFIGCEVAATASQLGLDVTVVDLAPRPLHAVLGGPVAQVCAEMLEDHRVRLVMGVGVVDLEHHDNRLTGVRLQDGRLLEADVAVIGLGAEPATEWLEGSGIPLDNGVVCDQRLRVAGIPGVVAAGDAARWPHARFAGRRLRVEHWTHAAMSGMAAARTLLFGDDADPYTALPDFWSDQFDVKIQGIGLPALATSCTVVSGSLQDRSFVATYARGGDTVGAVAFNATRGLARWRAQIGLRSEMRQTATEQPHPSGAGRAVTP